MKDYFSDFFFKYKDKQKPPDKKQIITNTRKCDIFAEEKKNINKSK